MTNTPSPSLPPLRPRRSVLYLPGSNARAIEKARTLEADCIILDLEDAVAPDVKTFARSQVCEAVSAGGFGAREVIIRINSLDTEWGMEDLKAAIQASPDAILFPKVSQPETLMRMGELLSQHNASENLRTWAMIETPMAMLNIAGIAACAHMSQTRLSCFVMGTNDLSKETGVGFGQNRLALLPWLMSALAGARAYGIDIIDGVFNTLDDEAGFEAECQQGQLCGFNGKTLIHPKQIAAANRIFAPSAPEIAQAQAIVAAFALPENASKGAISLNGRMVERLHAQMAERTLALASAIEARHHDALER
jgi:citrate lyase subunit beta / citryl-CoA lyase